MRKARVTVPAVGTNLGPGINSLGLALGLHVSAAFVERGDTEFLVETQGEGAPDLSADCYHPVLRAAIRVFQQLEDAPLGLRVHVRNNIPLDAGLGADAAMTVAGLMGANSLMGMPLSRDELIRIGAELLGRADGLVAAMLGGLTISVAGEQGVVYQRIDVVPMKVLVIMPELADYADEDVALPQTIELQDALHNIGRQALLVEALRDGDYSLLSRVLSDRILEPLLARRIPGYKDAVDAARRAGALAVTLTGNGPALLVFSLANHYKIADAVQRVFDERDTLSRVWTLTVDTQGVVVTAAEMHPG
jgi:homoserine kinase